MKTYLNHIQLNISDAKKSLPFYRDLFMYLGYEIGGDGKEYISAKNGTTDFWVMRTEEKHTERTFHRKSTGLNHLAFWVESKAKVDQFVEEFIKPNNITLLYNSPKHFPEYTGDYYAVFFEDPDRLKIEVMHNIRE